VADKQSRLIVAGRPIDEAMEEEIRQASADDPRVCTALRFIPDQELPLYFAVADVVLLPFRQITTSGSAILAMSFGRPVIAPADGCLPEYVNATSGILYDPKDQNGLACAIERCSQIDLKSMGEAAYQQIAPLTAQAFARRHLEIYQQKWTE
jgi:beta-1,4-mannosyltransferase